MGLPGLLYTWLSGKQPWVVVEKQMRQYLAFARLIIVQRRFDEVDRLLENMLHLAESSGLAGRTIEILILQALSLRLQDQPGQAIDVLERALSLVEPEGYTRLFLDEGERMKILLQETLRHKSLKLDGATRAYVTRMLAVFDNPENRQRSVRTSVSSSEALAEPLSEREIEILRLLVEGLSNREIARRLYISAGTVKVHLKHIYAKLDVSNRMEATARAHQLDLV